MATERHASLPSTSHEDDALFLDILHEAPLLGRLRRVGRGSSMDIPSYTGLDLTVALQLQCWSFTRHRFFPLVKYACY
ncbi:hypothetical protein CJ030_MR6G024477 [Morella rubra]|uniref:Uncharacterized protein n=1 Tax=Morella rubra TaxID=262757 RepID=A0A6A1VAV6_9ROSI|nr:hypothetical protein CJ030_MR6G024477 [Morella rubra]